MLEQSSAVVGLDQAQVRARVQAGLVNTAPPMPGRTVGQILRANVFTRFNAILGAMFVVVLAVGPVQDALFGVVLVVNTGFGVLQELRAKRELDRLAILTAARARVIRDGTAAEMPVDQVVLDDVLELRQGDQVPVDGVVLRSEGLEADEGLLTGEAEPVVKEPGEQVLSGSFVVAGTGRVRATGVGGEAYAARLQAQARRFSLIRSELQQGTNRILRLVTWVMIPAGLLVVVSEFFRSHDPLSDAARGSAAALVAMVPEGLVLLTSLAFTAGALRLARRRVLVQELAAVEGLARVDVLCIDKTGTLTRPGMRVSGTKVLGRQSPALIADVLGAVAAADDAPNGTIRALAARYDVPPGWTVRARTPFSSARKWSGVSFAGHGTWLLGAPSVVIGNSAELPDGLAAAIAGHETAGHRVLLLASTAGPLDGDRLPADNEPAALVVLAEELRQDAAETVRYLLGQGVEIKVLSGDAPRAVAAIARRAGIPLHGDPWDASGLSEDDDGGLAGALAAANVFGRVRPGHKLAAVRALQAAGHVVAMVGDGVNDVQALKQADLGIAMGSGSQAGRAVARVVLLDSSFAAIPRMLEEGRRVIANIERVAGLFVTKTVYAAIIAVAVGVAGVTYPFYPRHLTIISTLTIGLPGFFLALAPGAPLARPGFTGRVLTVTIPAGTAAAAAGLAAYAIARTADVSITAARTAAMLAVFAVGLWVLALIAGRPVARGAAIVATMGGVLVMLFTVPLARQVLGLQLPPVTVCVQVAGVVLASIGGLALWRRVEGGRQDSAGHRRGQALSGRHELGGDAAAGARAEGDADADAALLLADLDQFIRALPRSAAAGRWLFGAGITLVVLGAAACSSAGGSETGGVTASPSPAAPSTGAASSLEQQYEQVVSGVLPSVVQISTRSGSGSGVVYDTKGDIVTNAHVVGTATTVQVGLASGGKLLSAEVVGVFAPDDLAVIKVDSGVERSGSLHPASFGRSASVRVGEIVLAMGNPLGLTGTVTDGIGSATGRRGRQGRHPAGRHYRGPGRPAGPVGGRAAVGAGRAQARRPGAGPRIAQRHRAHGAADSGQPHQLKQSVLLSVADPALSSWAQSRPSDQAGEDGGADECRGPDNAI
ncbi:MAG TPA: HAD-IC family P-type ATPase [Streptosporangiaceae bacterium]|nr:HAD-IC family P-type ATPase [Streptosporangiaceae bacterium]